MKKDKLHLTLNCNEILDLQWCVARSQEKGNDNRVTRCQILLDKIKESQLNWIKG